MEEIVLDQQLQNFLEKFNIVQHLYQMARIIDPLKKKVMIIKGEAVFETQQDCFAFWKQNRICANCVSMRAYNENDSFMKVDYHPDKIVMVTAIPITLENNRFVVELLKDVTKNMLLKTNEQVCDLRTTIYNLNEAVILDGLTGVHSRNFIKERLPVDMLRFGIDQRPISIILLDIDHFKEVNDHYGHIVGDFILKSVANKLKDSIRGEDDWIARYGGEEFLCCFPHTELEETKNIAERLRASIEEATFVYDAETTIKVTASFGICTIPPNSDFSPEMFIDCADKKLYIAKENGRNQICY